MIKNLKLTWTSAAEGKMPNSLYVGATRAEKISNLAFTNAISIDDLSKIGKYPSVLRQRQELQILTDIAMHIRQNIDATVYTYVTEIQWLINPKQNAVIVQCSQSVWQRQTLSIVYKVLQQETAI